jgi:hypothetical protein
VPYRVAVILILSGLLADVCPADERAPRPSDAELLTKVQRATFRYFWDFGHPVSGLARDRTSTLEQCTIGGTGFGVMALMIGAERGFISREAAVERLLRIVRFLDDRAERYHGAFAHMVDGTTGRTIPFAWKDGVQADDGGDLVETALLMQGLLTVRQYVNRPTESEIELRRRIDRLWREVEWAWYLRREEQPDNCRLYWHWSPRYGWLMDHPIGGQFNECLIVYLLAIASPTHPIPGKCYERGWVGDAEQYANGRTYYGHRQAVGPPMGGPLFFTQYSFVGFDPRGWRDRFCNYFELGRSVSLIHQAYCIDNPRGHVGYGRRSWGLTACDTPDGYRAVAPGAMDNGTIAPTAALSAMPYTPEASLAALRHYDHELADRLWTEYGFRDAFHLDRDWFAPDCVAINQGPIVCMIENYRTGLCWRMFMANPEIEPALRRAGWAPVER